MGVGKVGDDCAPGTVGSPLTWGRMVTVDELSRAAMAALYAPPEAITEASLLSWPASPGLYAVFGADTAWHTLGLGEAPDARPLYVGKAERSLSSRDVGTHFGFAGGSNSITGSSTLRRSLAAQLRSTLGLRGRYRNPSIPKYASNYGLSDEHDELLSTWMRANLRATYWVHPATEVPLDAVETAVLTVLKPPLNLDKVTHRWRKSVLAARAVMAADCLQS